MSNQSSDYFSLSDYYSYVDVDLNGNLVFRVVKKSKRKNGKKKKD